MFVKKRCAQRAGSLTFINNAGGSIILISEQLWQLSIKSKQTKWANNDNSKSKAKKLYKYNTFKAMVIVEQSVNV